MRRLFERVERISICDREERHGHAEHAHLVGPLRERPARGREAADERAGPADAVQRQRRRLPEDQADGEPVRHRVGRRALGPEVQQGRADGVVRPLVAAGVSKQLYSIARDFSFWKDGSNYMGYPFSWSTVQIYYNPKYVKTKPGLVARAARPEVQGQDLAREHPDGHDGDRRHARPGRRSRTR